MIGDDSSINTLQVVAIPGEQAIFLRWIQTLITQYCPVTISPRIHIEAHISVA